MMYNQDEKVRAVWKAALVPTPECISIERLTETLNEPDARHLSICPRCKAELALLTEFERSIRRQEEGAGAAWIAQELRRRAAAGANRTAGRKPWLTISGYRFLAVAATVIMIAGASALYMSKRHLDPGAESAGGNELRSQSVVAVSPLGDLETAPAELRWQAVSSAASYAVGVQEVDHHNLWTSETTHPYILLPARLRSSFVPGKTLLWDVKAKNAAGEVLAGSGTQKFRVINKKHIGGEL